MNARAGGGIVRLILGAAAVASAAAAVTVTFSVPENPRAPEIAVRADPVPPMPTASAPKKPAPAPPAGAAELLLFLHPGTDPAAYARDHGLVHLHTLRSDRDAHVFAAADPSVLKTHRGRVRKAFLNERLQRVHCAFAPDDPYYDNDNDPAGFPGQWHLGNGATATHANVVAAWNRDVTGAGVLIGIVDDCLEIIHPDLEPNHSAADS
ncbi:MAG TPA: hypothetical protein VJB14_02575, partial [Planctomycetota bacterium]|nr:hypothetical protein [Planctomycetota bacterium]